MFVYRREDLPQDAIFPADLKKLGYFITKNDQIKKISDPEQEFQFRVNRHPRWNEVSREAMNGSDMLTGPECIRNIVSSRLRGLGLTTIQLPLSSGPETPRVPIWVSSNLSRASRVVVVFGEPVQDLGIWAYRTVGSESIDAGSAVAFAKAVLYNGTQAGGTSMKSDLRHSDTALVLANPGQLIWHCASSRAVSEKSWLALPRSSAVEPPSTMTYRNKIPQNGDWQEHVSCVFDEILAARGRLVRKDAKIDIIGLAEGGLGVIRYLAADWESWKPYVSAITLSYPLHLPQIDIIEDDPASPTSFTSFVASRCRAYVISDQPLNFPVLGFAERGCNCYSSGECLNAECIMPRAWGGMLEWLAKMHLDPSKCEAQTEFREVGGTASESAAEEN